MKRNRLPSPSALLLAALGLLWLCASAFGQTKTRTPQQQSTFRGTCTENSISHPCIIYLDGEAWRELKYELPNNCVTGHERACLNIPAKPTPEQSGPWGDGRCVTGDEPDCLLRSPLTSVLSAVPEPAITELQAQIDALKKEVEALKAKQQLIDRWILRHKGGGK